ncbi:hypothetical protein [Enterococcus saccharolyticus]|uniref:hypothetical protein n=1 Tax=Enterococcus saccharolyticus TaxID=41997 RepID=UPI0039DFB3E6
MALTIKKSTSLQGQSIIDGQIVVYLAANISTESLGNSTVSQSIQNQELYAANKAACRADIAEFQNAVFDEEDAMMAERE